ncbi:unnamed protein product [Gadus morhua 'NCC']
MQDRVQPLQGDNVTLSCNYTSADYFFWYLQYPSSPPQFLIKEYMVKSRFTLKKYDDRLLFALEISSVAVTDSALYYCAKENILEGTSVTLSYTLSKIATGNDYFFWYRQYPGEPPQFLLSISGFVTDSALYYCALRSTVTEISDSLYKNLLGTKHSSLFS